MFSWWKRRLNQAWSEGWDAGERIGRENFAWLLEKRLATLAKMSGSDGFTLEEILKEIRR